MVSNGSREEENLDRQKRLQLGHCCWHCRYYIRPIEELRLDGPVSSICVVDRAQNVYVVPGEMMPGDKERKPDEYCERFEMDIPSA